MNHLAHLHLGDSNSLHRLGQILGDFHKGSQYPAHWPVALVQGVRLHRWIDSQFLLEPHWRQLRAMLDPQHRRVSAIVMDVACDYFLAKHWQRFSGQTLIDFDAQCAAQFAANRMFWSQSAVAYLSRLSEGGRLCAYADIDTVYWVLGIIAQRLSKPSASLIHAQRWLPEVIDQWEAQFLLDYPIYMQKSAVQLKAMGVH